MKLTTLFSNPKKRTFTNYGIKKVLKTKYGHVATLIKDSRTDQLMVFEASHGEAHFINYGDWLKRNDIVMQYDKNITDEEYKDIVFTLNLLPQRGYDFKSIAGILVAFAFDLDRNIFGTGRDKMFCSEQVGLLFSKWYKIEKPLDLFNPKDLEQLIKNNIEDFIRIR